ncbi:amidohydrolase [Schnuerera sp. xch1]|uniref:M20 metallopeptidase family protein n=1 Tax=Schnuerera sp. xch1 TaxID=2874283 RepID=UPI001CC04BFE|nr:amidohydrolase [Schnuerera sp. xch1]MBZ2174136.1 amidohydrolase [Schnuerera sp. xch1]
MLDNDLLKSKVSEVENWVIDIRRDFHQFPELGMKEYRTRDKIIDYLNKMEIENKIVANTGVVAIIRGKDKGKTVGLRADMDALPMEDKKDVPYRSKIKGKMHACGHDVHMAILLGAAKILKSMKDNIKGNIKLFFQPAEETVGGAEPMIREGVMENPYVDGVFGLHVDNSLQTGQIGIKYGQMKAASDMIKIIIHGKNSHGAYPQNGIDAIAIAGQVIVALQTTISRNIDPRSSAVLTLGTIQGGYGRNIIADKVEIEGIIRTLNKESRRLMLNRVQSIVEGISKSMEGLGELIRTEGYPALINDDNMLNIVKQNAKELFGNDSIYKIPYPSYGVEDFAYFAETRPAAFFQLGSGNMNKGIIHTGHTSLFDIDEDCLSTGILLQVKNALEFLNK